MIPQWFQDIAEQIDFDAIDKETQKVFRRMMIGMADEKLPLKTDGTIVKAKKLALLKTLARFSK